MADEIHTDTIVPVDSIQIRPARLSDLDQLAALCEALWPKSSATEHAQELQLILGDKAALVLTMPLIIFVAEANGGTLAGFLEVDLRSHADGCNPSRPPPLRRRQEATGQGGGLGAQSQVRRDGFRCPHRQSAIPACTRGLGLRGCGPLCALPKATMRSGLAPRLRSDWPVMAILRQRSSPRYNAGVASRQADLVTLRSSAR
jgi:hypothetical protein